MQESLKKLNVEFNEAKRAQAKLTLDNLIQSAEQIVTSGDVGNFDARSLSRVSGYSLGSLVKRLGKIENIFLYAIAKLRSKKIQSVVAKLHEYDVNSDARSIVEAFVPLAFEEIKHTNPPVIRYYENRAVKRADEWSHVFAYTDEIIEPLRSIISQNRSGTFRTIEDHELPYVARAFFLFIERPFVEGDPIAGTELHRQMAVDALLRLIAVNREID